MEIAICDRDTVLMLDRRGTLAPQPGRYLTG